jgi:hypothetical protein
MPLITCSTCQTEVSNQAMTCPKCGHRLRNPSRTAFGNLVKWGFIAFNVLMPLFLFTVIGSADSVVQQAGNDAEKAGAAVGGLLGAGLFMFLWFTGFVGGGIAMLLTRPQR